MADRQSAFPDTVCLLSRPGGQVSGGDRDRAAALRGGGTRQSWRDRDWGKNWRRKGNRRRGDGSFTEEELTDSLIEYGELEELLKRGNASLKSAVSQYDTNLEIYQEALEVLSSAKQEMKEYAEELENEKWKPGTDCPVPDE